jgi:ligand-binding sensor domain-containing protein/serine phosphatase RsbU (regulator of sigma subunit)
MSARYTLLCRAGILVWLLLFVPVSRTEAQKLFFDSYGVKQGLSEQKVYTVFQDSKDYIWLGTANGLSRFDGRKFDNFSSRNGLSIGGVRCIAEDSSGNIWFGHLNGGVSRYNGKIFEQAAFDSVIVTGDVTSIIETDGKHLWFTSTAAGAILGELPVKDIRHILAKQFKGKDGLSDQVYGAARTRAGEYICIADVGTRKFIPGENKFENYRMPHMTTYFSPITLYNDTKGNLWFGTYNGGIYRYNLAESKMDVIDLIRRGMKSNWVSCFAEDSRGRIWVGTWGGGIGVFDGDSLTILDESKGLIASKICNIIEDVEGNILIGDYSNGLTIFKGDALITINEKEVLPDPNVNAIYQDKSGAVWFGTNAGISRCFPWSGKKPVIYDQKNNSIAEEIRFFREDKDGNLWVGSNNGGVIMFNMKTQQFESQVYINSRIYSDYIVKAMEIDRQNNLWIGTNDGVTFGRIGETNFERITQLDSITVDVISVLYCDPNGNMWIGTEPKLGRPGIFRYDILKKQFKSIKSLPGIMPKAMVMDAKGVLWIGTGEGLVAFRNDSILDVVTQDHGLLSDNIRLLADGGDGSIYIGTNIGLNRYYPASRRMFSYTQRNGFTGIESKPNAVFRTASGDLWFGTSNGATEVRQNRLTSKGLEPLTHIMGLQVNYEPRTMVTGLKLKYKERPIIFDYYSICLANPDVVRYKVKLEGADKDWRPVTVETGAIYSLLPPGKYTFQVIACNNEGIWNDKPVSYHFIIRPPFYLTWWFIIICIITIAAAIVVYIRVREQNLVRENLILEAKVEERTAEVVQKSLIIEEKNRDIMASIRYAERIQRAMLPREDCFGETFVLFLPKDVVSGDFYWMYDNGDTMFIAAVDCTGHGVPGAFMSIIGHNSLNKVVREFGLTKPSAILDKLNIEVIKSILQSHEKGINDGMDMSLIAIHKNSGIVEFAGAYNPLYLVRDGNVIVYKGDRFPIGLTTMEQKKTFTNVVIEIQPGDMLYMTSDGYADQFGSPAVKKFKSINVKRILSEIWDLPACDQKERLEKEIMEWKGDLPQVDDIMFVGTRVKG